MVFGAILLVILWNKVKPYWKELLNKWERQREIDNFGKQFEIDSL